MAAPNLSKMYGPLPMGAWVAVIGGGLGLALYTRHKSATAAANAGPAAEPTAVNTGTDSGVGVGGGGFTDVTNPNSNTVQTDTPPAIPSVNNTEWESRAYFWLIGHQKTNPALALIALQKFLAGSALSSSEYAIVQTVLGGYPELPPEGFVAPHQVAHAGGGVRPLPVPVPRPKPRPLLKPGHRPRPTPHPHPHVHTVPGHHPKPTPQHRYYTVQHGDNLWNISIRFYHSPMHVHAIAAANHITNPNHITPGERLLIP